MNRALPVGTKVKLKDNLDFHKKYKTNINSEMAVMRGKTTTIKKFSGSTYRLDIDGGAWCWSDDTFDVITQDANQLLDMLISGSISEKEYKEIRSWT